MTDEGDPGFIIPTRQKVDFLFTQAPPGLLTGGEVFDSSVAEVDGYAAVLFLMVSDQAFTLVTLEANSPGGTFIQTSSTASTLDATSGLQKVAVRVVPSGSLMQYTLHNTGGTQTKLELSPYGLPC